MKSTPSILCFSFLLLSSFFSLGQEKNTRFNKALADSLGGDERGMKHYVLCILKTGQAVVDSVTSDSLFRGHFSNMERLAAQGKLAVAGPLKKNERTYRGIFIFNVETIPEAQLLVKTDPAVAAGIFETELYEWYGSAAVSIIPEIHKRISKE